MNARGRFHEARLFVGGATIALLLGIWSALTVHDIQARTDTQTAVVESTVSTGTTVTSPAPTTSQPPANTTAPRQATTTQSAPHTRTRAS